MRSKINPVKVFYLIYAVLLFGIIISNSLFAGAGNSEKFNQGQSKLELFSVPKTQWPGFQDMVIDSGGSPWIMANNKVFYFTGIEFKEPVSPASISSGYYLAGLYGGPDRGAYATQKGTKEQEGLLYRLEDGEAIFVTNFYYEVSHEYPGLYVSKNGTLFNWGNRFLERFNGKTWERIEAKLSLKYTIIFDIGEKVYFYYDNSLYCAEPSGELKASECSKWINAKPGQNHIKGKLWAGKNALLVNYGEPGLFAFDLETGREIDVWEKNKNYEKTRFYDVFSLTNVEVWILGGSPYSFYKLSVDGLLAEIPETKEFHWDNHRCWQVPESVLETSKKDIIFGLPKNGLALIREGQLNFWGWEYGLSRGISYLHEDLDGNLWFPMGDKIAKLTLNSDSPDIIPEVKDWEEIKLIPPGNMLRLKSGQLAMFRQGSENKLSLWDGQNWTNREVPFPIKNVMRCFCDDREHLFVCMNAYPDGCYDIGPDSIEKFENIEMMLEKALKNGAQKFYPDFHFSGIEVSDDKRIWFGYAIDQRVHLFDGDRWDTINCPQNILFLFPSYKYGILFRDFIGRFYRYDRGQIVEIEPSLQNSRCLMAGPWHLQPYERELIDNYPNTYIPVIQEQKKLWILSDADRFEKHMDENDITNKCDFTEIPIQSGRFIASVSGGTWVINDRGYSKPYRIIQNKIYDINTINTPLDGKDIVDVKEDLNGDLWFLTRSSAFHYRLSNLSLSAGTVPDNCQRTLECKIALEAERMADDVQFIYRLNKGNWLLPKGDKNALILRFPESGRYNCEIVGVKMGGLIKSHASFNVNAHVALPETILTATVESPIHIDTIEWKPPVSIQKTSDGASATLLWREIGGYWRKASDNGNIMLVSLKPGMHTIELAAEEDGFWRDKSPVSVTIDFEPDYEKIINFYVLELLSNDIERKNNARNKLIELKDKSLPMVEQKLQDIEQLYQNLHELRRLLNDLRQQ